MKLKSETDSVLQFKGQRRGRVSINAQETSLFIWLFLEKVFWFQKSFPQLNVHFQWFFFSLATSVKHRSAVLFYLPGKISFLLDVTLPLNDFKVQIPGGVVDIWQSRP